MKQETERQTLSIVVKKLWQELRTKADFSLAVASMSTLKAYYLLCNQFGTLIVTDSYIARGLPESDAEQHLSFIFLLSSIIGLFWCFFIGYLSDKVKIYQLLNTFNIILLALDGYMIYQIVFGGLENLGLAFDVCLVASMSLLSGSAMMCVTIISKLVNP